MFFGVLICFTLCRFATTQQVLCYQSPRVKSSKPISYKHASCHVSLGGWCGWITSCIGGNDLNTVMCNGQPNVAHQQEVWYLTGNTYTDTIQYNLYIVLKYHQIANRHKLPGWKIKKTSLKSISSVTQEAEALVYRVSSFKNPSATGTVHPRTTNMAVEKQPIWRCIMYLLPKMVMFKPVMLVFVGVWPFYPKILWLPWNRFPWFQRGWPSRKATHPWELTVGTPSHGGSEDEFPFSAGWIFRFQRRSCKKLHCLKSQLHCASVMPASWKRVQETPQKPDVVLETEKITGKKEGFSKLCCENVEFSTWLASSTTISTTVVVKKGNWCISCMIHAATCIWIIYIYIHVYW